MCFTAVINAKGWTGSPTNACVRAQEMDVCYGKNDQEKQYCTLQNLQVLLETSVAASFTNSRALFSAGLAFAHITL